MAMVLAPDLQSMPVMLDEAVDEVTLGAAVLVIVEIVRGVLAYCAGLLPACNEMAVEKALRGCAAGKQDGKQQRSEFHAKSSWARAMRRAT